MNESIQINAEKLTLAAKDMSRAYHRLISLMERAGIEESDIDIILGHAGDHRMHWLVEILINERSGSTENANEIIAAFDSYETERERANAALHTDPGAFAPSERPQQGENSK